MSVALLGNNFVVCHGLELTGTLQGRDPERYVLRVFL